MPKSKFSNEDLARWKREINPAPIFAKRIANLHRENAEFVGTCPPAFHEKNVGHPDKTPSFKVYKLEEGVWAFKCFGCGANGNVFQFVQQIDGVSFVNAVKTVLEEAGVSGWQDGEEQPDSENLPAQEAKEHVTFTMAQYQQATVALEHSPEAQRWLAARGISMVYARNFYLGFVQSAEKVTPTNAWMNDGWVLFPTLSADHQTITAVKYRSLVAKKAKIDGKENSGILRAPNTSTTLYNLQAVVPGEDVWIVEGEPDTVVLAQAGLTAVGYPGASYKPTDEECAILSTAKCRFLAGDNDQTGVKTMAELAKRLRGETHGILWPNNRKDANDVLTNECGNDTDKFKDIVDELRIRVTQKVTEPILRNGDQIKPRRIKWLWHEKIPLGKVTLFAGNPDNGKSLATTSVAAYCTKGLPFPGSDTRHEPSDVLMLLGEDDLEDTAVPRLIAAEADMKRIHFLEAVRPCKEVDREVRLDMDIPAIERQLESNPKIRLLIIDPISNYLGDVSMVAEQEVRGILIPLKRAAEKFNIAIILVMHLNKKNDLDAISRVGGAMAFIGVARCSWLFVRDQPEEPEEGIDPELIPKKPDTFSMLRIKNNLVSASRAGLSYSVAVRDVAIPGESDAKIPYTVWGTVIEGSADEALGSNRKQAAEPRVPRGVGRPSDKLQAAIQWLQEALQDGEPHAVKVLNESAYGESGIKKDTLLRAWETFNTKAKKIKGVWCWQLSPMHAMTSEEPVKPEQSSLIDVEGVE